MRILEKIYKHHCELDTISFSNEIGGNIYTCGFWYFNEMCNIWEIYATQ